MQKARELHQDEQRRQQLEADHACVAELLHHHGNGKPADGPRRQEAVAEYGLRREARVKDFLEALRNKRDSFLTQLASQATVA